MKTRPAHSRRAHDGSAIIVILTFLSVMVVLLAANTVTLNRLTQEVRGLEKRQIQRLDPSLKPGLHSGQSATNFPAGK